MLGARLIAELMTYALMARQVIAITNIKQALIN